MTAAKAWVGGLTSALTTVLMYFADLWPPIAHMPPDVHAALAFVVSGILTAAAVYFTPNTPKEQ